MAWLTEEQIRAALAEFRNAPSGDDLVAEGSFWPGLVAKAGGRAREQILTAFLSRGFSQAQVEAWDYLAEAHRDQSLYWLSVYGAGKLGLEPEVVEVLNRLDRSAALATTPLIVAGEQLEPARAMARPVGHGPIGSWGLKYDDPKW